MDPKQEAIVAQAVLSMIHCGVGGLEILNSLYPPLDPPIHLGHPETPVSPTINLANLKPATIQIKIDISTQGQVNPNPGPDTTADDELHTSYTRKRMVSSHSTRMYHAGTHYTPLL